MNTNGKTLTALLLTAFLLTPASAYMGKQLARGPVDAFTLTDQYGEDFSFDTDAEGVVIVSFIFTRCPDVCPVLTVSLSAVEDELSKEERDDVTFVSISVDPNTTPPKCWLNTGAHGSLMATFDGHHGRNGTDLGNVRRGRSAERHRHARDGLPTR